jgi:hypothetical protein
MTDTERLVVKGQVELSVELMDFVLRDDVDTFEQIIDYLNNTIKDLNNKLAEDEDRS